MISARIPRVAVLPALACLLLAGCATRADRIVAPCSPRTGTWVPSATPPAHASAMMAATDVDTIHRIPGVRDYWLEGTEGRWLLCRADLRRGRPGCSSEGHEFVPAGEGWDLGKEWIRVCGYD